MSAVKPIFHLLAGPNGAGKSTLYSAFVASGGISSSLESVNADLYEQKQQLHVASLQKRSQAARDWPDTRRETPLNAKAGFVSETVFSHDSKLTPIKQAQAEGFHVVLYVVSVNDPKTLLTRVSQRVREGGHNVPSARILARYPRAMDNLKQAVRLADLTFVYDAADIAQGGPVLVAMCEKNKTTALVDAVPDWAVAMLPGV